MGSFEWCWTGIGAESLLTLKKSQPPRTPAEKISIAPSSLVLNVPCVKVPLLEFPGPHSFLSQVLPCIQSILSEVWPAKQRGRAFAALYTISALGGMGGKYLAVVYGSEHVGQYAVRLPLLCQLPEISIAVKRNPGASMPRPTAPLRGQCLAAFEDARLHMFALRSLSMLLVMQMSL